MLLLHISGIVQGAFANLSQAISDPDVRRAEYGSRLVDGATGLRAAIKLEDGWHIDAAHLDLPSDAIAGRIAPGVLSTLGNEGGKAAPAPPDSGVVSCANGRGRGGEVPHGGKGAAGGGR